MASARSNPVGRARTFVLFYAWLLRIWGWVPEVYALTWIGIGVSLLRGQPELNMPILKPE
jgi:hypothetical protein